ncbi:MAG: hypothetical protein QF664_08050 [Dehalococcoidia bacterium]|jgi:hypothetical protein|nr:hypothetical protein [Dehalococcoidia bacterium]
MNFFRSEEHARNWSQWNPEAEQQLQPLEHYAERFAGEMFRARVRPDFMSWLDEQRRQREREQEGK